MDSIIHIRQMMAEQKFFESQKLIEVQLQLNADARHELLLLYYDCLKNQHKNFPIDLTIELAEKEALQKNFEFALNLISKLNIETFFLRMTKIKIQAAEEKGMMEELYSHLSDFLLRHFEKQNPSVPDWINALIDKYFKADFHLKLKRLGLLLLLNDLKASEELTKDLIITSVEKSSPKGVGSKLQALSEVLRSGQNKAQLEIYQNFCHIYANGISDKTDYKRLVEMAIFFDDFKFQCMLLSLLHKTGLTAEAEMYADAVRENKQYSFVYFDKFFPQLKNYFFHTPREKAKPIVESIPAPDLKLTDDYRSEMMSETNEPEFSDDEQNFLNLLKYQTYSTSQLCDLAVSFLQSEMPKVALRASELAIKEALDDRDFLKASYLRLTCQLMLNDFRAAVDTCFEALTKASSRDDILSFMYGQAEAFIRLNQMRNAKAVLSKIVSIDAKYRLAKERLDKLNEI